MSRFSNLEFSEEFDGELQHDPSGGSKPLFKDEAHYLLQARTAFEGGQFEEALRHYAKVLEFNPANSSAWTGQVRMLIELNEFQEAKQWSDKALERFPNDPELLAAKAVTLARLGDLKAALAYSDASLEEQGETPYVWLARGDVQMASAEKRAHYCFERALALAPRDWFVRWLAARVHYFYRKFASAVKLLLQALELNSGHAVLWLQLGFCQQALGLTTPAKASFQNAREFSPHCREADDALRKLYQVGFWEKLNSRWRQLFHE